MGWFWDKGEGSNEALRKLDPNLKDFLEREKPAEYVPKTSSPPPSHPESEISHEPQKAVVPPESLFQDGRYAHLWKTYTPLTVLEQRGKTDQEKLADIVEAFNDRQGEVGRAALENCSLENMSLHDCYRHGSFSDRITNCRKQVRSLDRCYTMQQKFLKALGYLSVAERSPEEEERIQMHADKLYQQMLQQEEMIDRAKKEGKPIPQFAPIFSPQSINAAMDGKPALVSQQTQPQEEVRPPILSELSDSARADFESRLREKKGIERELEIKAIAGEIEASKALSKEVGVVFEEERRSRAMRREAGRETFGDMLKRWGGWK